MPEGKSPFRALGRAGLILLWLSGGALLVGISRWRSGCHPTVHRLWFRGLARLLDLRMTVTGQSAPGPVLVVANHISWLDIVVLGCQAPTTFVAKDEVARWPLLGVLARRSGTLFITRNDLRAVKRGTRTIAQRLRGGERVAIFPEGTTTRGERVLPFRPALLQAAVDTLAPVQPVTLRYLGDAATTAPFVGDDTFVASLWRILQLPHTAVHCHWHHTLQGKERRRLADQAWQIVTASLQDLPPGQCQATVTSPPPPASSSKRALSATQ